MYTQHKTTIAKQSPWYQVWFDTSYYDILYRDRNQEEAHAFIDSLLGHLQVPPNSKILDLACGKGRYARYLAEKGFVVSGLDLSEHSIQYARAFESDRLEFYVHDMRKPFRSNYYDFVFNFFTSFGYFDREADDLSMLQSVSKGLKAGGVFILDFFNSTYVRNHLQGFQVKEVDGISFALHKYIDRSFVKKKIEFQADGRSWEFEEQVRLYQFADFERMFLEAGLEITAVCGDYQLQPFQEATTPRLIIQAQKK